MRDINRITHLEMRDNDRLGIAETYDRDRRPVKGKSILRKIEIDIAEHSAREVLDIWGYVIAMEMKK